MTCRRPRLAVPILAVALFAIFAWTSPGRPAAAAEMDFAHQVAPILRKHCGECHAGDVAKGGFSINSRTTVLDGGAEPGRPDESRLLELITSADPDEQMPPADRARVPAEEVETLRAWIAADLPWQVGFRFAVPSYEPPLRPRHVALPPAVDGREHPIDRLLDAWRAERGIARPERSDDATFLRRASLDLTGLLPTADETRAFLADPSPAKRAELIDRLLADDVAYTEHWLTFWNDLLRNDYTGTGFITGGRSQITGWLYRALLENMPYDAMARELVAPTADASRGFSGGIKWRGEVSAGQTVEIQFAQSVGQAFLGINIKCASCHDSFIDRWTLEDSYGLAAVIAESPSEIARCDVPTGRTAKPAWLFPELGTIDPGASKKDRLEQLAALLTHPEDGRFPRTLVNRFWHRLMGRGLVEPVDAMQTRPWNEDLLDWLAVRFRDDGYDLKKLLRLIATSEAYNARSAVVTEEPAAEGSPYTGPYPKRLTAEQFVDAVWQLTGTAPTKVADTIKPVRGDAAKSGRMVRAALVPGDDLMRSLGRPIRDQIVSTRPAELTTLEAVDLANHAILADGIAGGAERWHARLAGDPASLVEALALATMGREPGDAERETLMSWLAEHPGPGAVEDVLWALLVSPEFLIVR